MFLLFILVISVLLNWYNSFKQCSWYASAQVAHLSVAFFLICFILQWTHITSGSDPLRPNEALLCIDDILLLTISTSLYYYTISNFELRIDLQLSVYSYTAVFLGCNTAYDPNFLSWCAPRNNDLSLIDDSGCHQAVRVLIYLDSLTPI